MTILPEKSTTTGNQETFLIKNTSCFNVIALDELATLTQSSSRVLFK